LRPGAITDTDVIFAAAIGASLKPALVTADDTIYAIPSISAAKGTALVVDADVIYQPGIMLFLVPQLVANDDAIAHADVGCGYRRRPAVWRPGTCVQ
jgi:hypothetical protein